MAVAGRQPSGTRSYSLYSILDPNWTLGTRKSENFVKIAAGRREVVRCQSRLTLPEESFIQDRIIESVVREIGKWHQIWHQTVRRPLFSGKYDHPTPHRYGAKRGYGWCRFDENGTNYPH